MTDLMSRSFTQQGGFTSGIEGPACDRDGNVYAVNYGRQGTIGIVTQDGEARIWTQLPEGSVGSGIRFNANGDMLVADYAKHHIFKIDRSTKELSVWVHEPHMHQPNDIAIARDGTLFASDPDWNSGRGRVWRIDKKGRATIVDEHCGTTNGIELSPDERQLYVSESVQRSIWVYELDEDKNMVSKRMLIQFSDYLLDGMRCDLEGSLYATRYGKGTVAVISPEGELQHEVRLLGKNPTNLTFGGPDGTSCYVTLSDHGNLERFKVDVPGRCWGMWR